MKNKLFLLFLAITFNSCSQEDSQYKIIDSFIQSVILDKNENWDKVYNYIIVDTLASDSEKERLLEIIKLNIYDIRTKIGDCSSSYEIVSHSTAPSKILSDYKLKYDYPSSVYYLICDNKVLAPFVIKHGKIIAFFSTLKKTKEQNYKPWILNQVLK